MMMMYTSNADLDMCVFFFFHLKIIGKINKRDWLFCVVSMSHKNISFVSQLPNNIINTEQTRRKKNEPIEYKFDPVWNFILDLFWLFILDILFFWMKCMFVCVFVCHLDGYVKDICIIKFEMWSDYVQCLVLNRKSINTGVKKVFCSCFFFILHFF